MINLNDVLLAMSNIPVDDPIAEIWGRGLQGGRYTVIEYTGALPITINANGEALIDYRIYGNTEQTGTPTPENPIMPSGCGVRTENLFDYVSYFASIAAYKQYFGYANIQLSPNTTYTLSTNFHSGTSGSLAQTRETPFIVCNTVDSPSTLTGGFGDDSSVSVTTVDDGIIELYFRISRGDPSQKLCDLPTLSDFENGKWVMIVEGSTPFPYEPYGYKLPMVSRTENLFDLSSYGSTALPYEPYRRTVTPIYLGEAETTRRIKKLVLTGEEGITQHSIVNNIVGVCIPTPTVVAAGSPIICTHATNVSWANYYGFRTYAMVTSNAGAGNLIIYMSAPDSEHNTLSDIKAYLADQYANGTPVTVWYVLAEPETTVINEPLMKIGNYADTISMEQAGVSIPTNKGTTVIDYDGTPKPSKMYIKYLGVKK